MSKKIRFTVNRISQFKCPASQQQAFLWDSSSQGLALRVTPKGAPSFIFQSRLHGKTIRMTIGSPKAWGIGEAQAKAREYQRQLDEGYDPRQLRKELRASQETKKKEETLKLVTFGEVFHEYLEVRMEGWGKRHYLDQVSMVSMGKKGRPGVLWPLVNLKLCDVDSEIIEDLMRRESARRQARARLALRHLRAFFTWTSEHKKWRNVADSEAASSRKLRELVGQCEARTDHIEKDQLKSWLAECQSYPNQVISSFFQILLLTGARREELAQLCWEDVDLRWNMIKLKDKNVAHRVIPLTPYVRSLINCLPRKNKWVFSSERSKSGRLVEPGKALRKINERAQIVVSIHGLRRSFKSLTEWLDVPVGVVAQIMGHKPSAIAEKHYTQRPIDLLRVHHVKIETWILEVGKNEYNVKEIRDYQSIKAA